MKIVLKLNRDKMILKVFIYVLIIVQMDYMIKTIIVYNNALEIKCSITIKHINVKLVVNLEYLKLKVVYIIV